MGGNLSLSQTDESKCEMALCLCEALPPPQVQREVSTSQYLSTTKRRFSLLNILHLIQSQLQLRNLLEVHEKFILYQVGKEVIYLMTKVLVVMNQVERG